MQLFKQHPRLWKRSDVLSLDDIVTNGLLGGQSQLCHFSTMNLQKQTKTSAFLIE